jgi:hypothetical protein
MKYINKDLFRIVLPHLIAIFTFLGVAIIYCKPAFENKVLQQEDVMQWQGMARNSFQYKETHGHFPLWSNSMFSGMPAFQIAMDPESVNVPGLFYGALTFYLTKPASFFFLACLCFYFLCAVLKVNPYIGIIGALAYAYATYNPVIVAVGHDTKMQSIALLPGIIASLIFVCEKKYWLGMVLLTLFTSLLVSFNHIQIVYYTMVISGGLLVGYSIPWFRKGEARRVGLVLAIVVGAGVIGILCNAVVLFTTYDSSKESVRGGSELADAQGNMSENGLSDKSAFDFSMYKPEPFVMLVPDIYGGSTDLELPAERSKAVRAEDKMPKELQDEIGEDGPRYYWGGVGEFFSGPPYVGAIVVLLALLGFFILDGRHKWWILGVCVLSIVMSWGGYFQSFNGLLLKYLPFYNKFRAPSMILVVPTFLFCMMAVLTLERIRVAASPRAAPAERIALWRQYKWGMLLMAGIFLLLTGCYFGFDYSSNWEQGLLKRTASLGTEAMGYMQDFVRGLQEDRRMLFGQSILRSLFLVATAALVIGLYIRGRVKPAILLGLIGVLTFGDVISMDLKYLNSSNYKERADYQQNFAATKADRQIMLDKGYFRVFDLRDSAASTLTYGAMTAYFHRSIGGYHAAKLKIYEDLIDRQLYNFPNCSPVVNMLNTKYIIKPTGNGGDSVFRNKGALGPVWFVAAVKFEPAAQDVMDALTHLHPKDTAIVFSADSSEIRFSEGGDTTAATDTTGTILLVKNDNDEITYLSQAPGERFAVFSEVYYNRGWKAYIDDHEAPIIRTNYVLRGLSVPPGRHIIRFFFRPVSYYLGRQVQWMASIIFLLMLAGAIIVGVQEFRKKPDSLEDNSLMQAA